MTRYNIIKKDDKYSVEMGWTVAEMFTDFLARHNMQYQLKCGDSVWTREVEFWGDESAIKKAYDWIEMIKCGLSPCPFCGGIAKLKRRRKPDGNISYEVAQVVCQECGASSRSVIVDGYYGAETTEQDAKHAWNLRYRR